MCLSLRESVSANTVSFCVPLMDTASHTVHASGHANAREPDPFHLRFLNSDPPVVWQSSLAIVTDAVTLYTICAMHVHVIYIYMLVAINTYACVYLCAYMCVQASRSASLQRGKSGGASTPKPASLHFLKSPGPALMH